WQSEGDSLPDSILTYRSTGSAVAGDDGCLVVTLSVAHSDGAAGSTSAPLLETTDETVWCPGRGGVSSEFSNTTQEGTTTGEAESERLPNDVSLEASTLSPPPDFSGFEAWTVEPVPLYVRDPLF